MILGEGDLVLDAPAGQASSRSVVTALQGDLEPIQGLHFILTAESWMPGGTGTAGSYGGWGAVAWFCFPRVDVMWRHMAFGSDRLDATALLLQGHIYL